jgi:2'-5' RNA ligase
MERLGYPPHLTLAVYDEISLARLESAFERATTGLTQIVARFEKLGVFMAPHAIILLAAPILPIEARNFHDRIHSAIEPDACRPNYRPGVWVPHCSIATAIDHSRKQEVIDLVKRPLEPFDVVFNVADCASFMPIKVVCEKELPVAV